jgi:NADPH-dependent ferric siderophore reductase
LVIAMATPEHEPPSAPAPPPALVRAVLLVGDAASGAAAVPAIEAILSRYGGRRIGEVTSLGTVAVETTAEGIRMLRATPVVQAVLEDEPLTLLH